jgi:cell division protein ZapE
MNLVVPSRYETATLNDYRPVNESQSEALRKAGRFVRLARVRYRRPGWIGRMTRRRTGLRGGMYLVGPVGTGKTHLLAAVAHELNNPEDGLAPVSAGFTHSADLFAATATPESYASRIAAQYQVLCIDEVELDDPANEVRLIGVLRALRAHRVTIAASSNAEPDKFVSATLGRDRLERFISEEFEQQYHVIFVGGEDYRRRLEKPGRAWIGDQQVARSHMRAAFEQDAREAKAWLDLPELLTLSANTERRRLSSALAANKALYLEGLDSRDANDALRLLRIIDDLYQTDDPPELYFTATRRPEEWFTAEGRLGVDAAIADKFVRTTSRLAALCEFEEVDAL